MSVWAFNGVELVIAAPGLWQAGRRAAATPRALITITDVLGTDYVAMLRATGIDLPDLRTTVIARGQAEGTDSRTGFSPGRRMTAEPRSTAAEAP